MTRNPLILLAVLSLPVFAAAQDDVPAARKQNLAAVTKAYQDNLKSYKQNKDILVRPGMVADRKAKQVEIMAEATAIGATDPAEFILISRNSGHDYEAMAVSLAKPSDIHNALVFIGMSPGQPVDYRKLRMWPKGERVGITFEWDYAAAKEKPSKTKHYRVRAESLILNRETDGPIEPVGFAFVGSTWAPDPDKPGNKLYSADVSGPNCIVSLYNDPETVLDWPGQAFKEAVYSLHLPNPRYQFNKGQLINVIIEPEHKDDKKRIAELQLIIGTADNKVTAATMANLDLQLKCKSGKALTSTRKLADVLTAFEDLTANHRDPHVLVQFGDNIALDTIHKVCSILKASEADNGIRIGPPAEGRPYYQAFLPDEELRDRSKRIMQPWEFKISKKGTAISSVLTHIKTVWIKDKQTTVVDVSEITTPDALEKKISKKSDTGRLIGPAAVFVFAPRTMNYGALRPFLARMVKIELTVFIYLD